MYDILDVTIFFFGRGIRNTHGADGIDRSDKTDQNYYLNAPGFINRRQK